jgi:hypothetical protein
VAPNPPGVRKNSPVSHATCTSRQRGRNTRARCWRPMPSAKRLRSPRSAIRAAVAILVLGLGLTLAGSEATASTSTLSESPETVGNGANITFTYSTPAATVSSTNWVGIYQPGQVPGQVGSITYVYAPQPSGTVTISASSLDGVGQYQAYYLYNNGYQQLAGPVDFTVVDEPPAPAPRVVRVFSPEGQAGLDDPFCAGRGRPGRRMGGRHGQQPAGRVLLLMGRSSMTGAAQARGPASSITPLP